MNIYKNGQLKVILKKDIASKRFIIKESSNFWKCFGQPQELFVVVREGSGLKPGQYIRKFSNGAFFLTKEYMVDYEYKICLIRQISFEKYQNNLLKVN